MAPGDIEVFLPAFREDDFRMFGRSSTMPFRLSTQGSGSGENIFLSGARTANLLTKSLLPPRALSTTLSPWQARAIITLYLAMLFYWVGDCFRPSHDLEKTPPVAPSKRLSHGRLPLSSKAWEIDDVRTHLRLRGIETRLIKWVCNPTPRAREKSKRVARGPAASRIEFDGEVPSSVTVSSSP